MYVIKLSEFLGCNLKLGIFSLIFLRILFSKSSKSTLCISIVETNIKLQSFLKEKDRGDVLFFISNFQKVVSNA